MKATALLLLFFPLAAWPAVPVDVALAVVAGSAEAVRAADGSLIVHRSHGVSVRAREYPGGVVRVGGVWLTPAGPGRWRTSTGGEVRRVSGGVVEFGSVRVRQDSPVPNSSLPRVRHLP